MSISPPCDIVLDVVRAADPDRYRQAVARLDRSPAIAETPFDDVLTAQATAPKEPKTASPAAPGDATRTDRGLAPTSNAAAAYQSFEAMVLASLFEAAMSSDDTGFFGDGVAASTWKSMLIEQIGIQMAKAGGIGIAAKLAGGAQTASLADGSASVDAARSLLIANVEGALLAAEPNPLADRWLP